MTSTAQRYAKELMKLCAGKGDGEIDRVASRFASLLIERRQHALLPAILEAVEAAPEPGSVEVTMTTSVEPDPKTSDALRKGLEKKLGKSVHLTTATDSALIGGATLRYDDVLFDGSLRRKLDALKHRLSQ